MYVKKLTADNDDIDVKAYASLKGILLTAGSDAATAIIYDAETVAAGASAGSDLATVKVVAGTSVYVPFMDGCLVGKSAISVDVSGTSPLLYLYFE